MTLGSGPIAAVFDSMGATLTAYRHAGRLPVRLGEIGSMVMNKRAAFLLYCIDTHIIWTGWAELIHIA